MSHRPALARLASTAVGITGVVVAHELAYRLAHGDHVAHAHALESSGHGYWRMATLVAMAAIVVGIGVQICFGRTSNVPTRRSWGHLLAIQGLTFVALELVERAVQAPEQLGLLVSEPAFWLALPLLALTAAIGAVILSLAAKTGAVLARRTMARSVARGVIGRLCPRDFEIPSFAAFDESLERAPPTPLFI